MFCLGISGQKRVGKDSISEILLPLLNQELNCSFIRMGFADAVKHMLCFFHYTDPESGEKIKVNRDFIEKFKVQDNYIPKGWLCNVRQGLINIGDRFREICPEVWIDIVLANKHDKIITDVRYPNEARNIYNDPKGLVIRVLRDIENNINDPSETSLLQFDKKLPENFEGPCNFTDIPYHYVIRNNVEGIDNLTNKIKSGLLPFILNKWKYLIQHSNLL